MSGYRIHKVTLTIETVVRGDDEIPEAIAKAIRLVTTGGTEVCITAATAEQVN